MSPTECLRALGAAYTYDPRRNEWLRAGLFLGTAVSALLLAFRAIWTGVDEGVLLGGVMGDPSGLTALAYPVLFGLGFGAMGTVRRDLDRHHERAVARLNGLAMTDPLTGLYNRRCVEQELGNLLHRSERTGTPVSVVFFDLNDFKSVNQRQGHRGGDVMLKAVAEALQEVLRRGEILGRYGGDEFLLVVAADLPYATNLVERAVEFVKVRTGQSLSAGVARSRDDGTTAEELIAAADARLARAQASYHAGRGWLGA